MKTIVTIGREYGSGGRIIAQKVAKLLQVPFYDKELIQEVCEKTGYSEEYVKNSDQRPTGSFLYDLYFSGQTPSVTDQIFIAQSHVIRDLADKGGCIIVGRCADYVLQSRKECLKVFVNAPLEERVRRAREEYGVMNEKLQNFVLKQDKYRASYYNFFTTGKWGSASNYDLCINSRLGLDQTAEIIAETALRLEKSL